MSINIERPVQKFGNILGDIHSYIIKYSGNKSDRARLRRDIETSFSALSSLIQDNESLFESLFSAIRESLSEINPDTTDSIKASEDVEKGILKAAGFQHPDLNNLADFYNRHRDLANGEDALRFFESTTQFSEALQASVFLALDQIDASVEVSKRAKKRKKGALLSRIFHRLAGISQSAFNIYAPAKIREDSFASASVNINFSNRN